MGVRSVGASELLEPHLLLPEVRSDIGRASTLPVFEALRWLPLTSNQFLKRNKSLISGGLKEKNCRGNPFPAVVRQVATSDEACVASGRRRRRSPAKFELIVRRARDSGSDYQESAKFVQNAHSIFFARSRCSSNPYSSRFVLGCP